MTEEVRHPVSVEFDHLLILLVLLLAATGVVAMGSASMDFAAERYGSPFYHLFRHGIYLVLGGIALWLTVQVPLRLWEELGGMMLVVTLLLLALVLIPGLGRSVNGSTRWLNVGPLSMQVSELAKFCFLIYVADYVVRREVELTTRWSGILPPVGMLAVVLALLILEPDFGAAVVLATATLGMLFVAGARFLPFFLMTLGASAGAVALAVTSPYRLQRLVSFLDPWANQFDSGYQLTQALIAFGRGSWTGVGLGNSVQKLFYLPEAHTDFVFAILAEELGLIGAVLVLTLFALLLWRTMQVAQHASARKQKFGASLACGVSLLFAVQIFINVGVNTGLLPTKGLTLPFLSYGGTSLIVSCALMGLVLRVDRETRDRGARSRAGW